MQTNFFQQLANMQIEGDWKISIKTGTHNRMIVSVRLTSDNVGDAAKKLIPPILLKGSAEELDKAFFETIKTPVQKTSALLLNMEEFEKGLEKAKLESKMEQGKKDRDKKEKDSKQKQYDNAMKKVQELEDAGKFREAYAQLPKADDFEYHEEEIEEKQKELSAKFEQPQLF